MMIMIDFTSRKPIYEQLQEGIIRLAVLGVIKHNEQLPSVRTLAGELAINPNTVQKAYQELERDGFVYSTPGRGSFLSGGIADNARLQEKAKERLADACIYCKLVNIKREEAVGIIHKAYGEDKSQ